MRALGLLAALVLAAPASAGWVRLTWAPIAGVTGVRSGCVAAGQYERPLVATASGSAVITGLPDVGRCYFTLNAGPQDEWSFDFGACAVGECAGARMPPGEVRNLTITTSPTPPVPAGIVATPSSITFTFVRGGALPSPQSIRITAPGRWSTNDQSSFYDASVACWAGAGRTCASGASTTLTPSSGMRQLGAGTHRANLTVTSGALSIVVPVSVVVQ